MDYRKLAADELFTGYKMLGSEAVLIIDDNGGVKDIVDLEDAGDGIEKLSGMITPGFVNCHCHLELSHLKGVVPERTGMIDFLLSVIGKRDYSLEIIYEAIERAENEMVANGIVAVGDICNTSHTISTKKNKRLYYHSFIEVFGFIEAVAEARFEAAVPLYKQFTTVGASSVVPHAPYSVSPALFKLIDDFERNSLLTIHNQESAAENEFLFSASGDFLRLYSSLGTDIKHFAGTGKTSMVTALDQLSEEHKIILVHNVLTRVDDLEFVQSRLDKLYWCLCPNANLYINGELPDVNLLTSYSSNIVLGTDSLASNHQLNILGEIETLHKQFPAIEYAELLKWATINGAKALGIDDVYGSFEKGKRPGIAHIDAGIIKKLA